MADKSLKESVKAQYKAQPVVVPVFEVLANGKKRLLKNIGIGGDVTRKGRGLASDITIKETTEQH